mgnify:CR=1 FL=1
MKTIITIGSGYSGSSAIYEFLQKMKKFHDPFPNQEFSLTYDPGGIMDIENCILNKSTINQNNYVYEQFKKNILYYLNKASSLKPGKEFKSQNFEKLSLEYLNSIISLKYEGESLFSKHKKNILKNFFSKFMFRLFKSKSSNNSILFKDYNEFIKNTEIFFNKLFMQEGHSKDIILDQGGIFTNPFGSTKFFNNSHCILVYRDPRDIYSEFKTKTLSAFPKKDVITFCTWYENIMNKTTTDTQSASTYPDDDIAGGHVSIGIERDLGALFVRAEIGQSEYEKAVSRSSSGNTTVSAKIEDGTHARISIGKAF